MGSEIIISVFPKDSFQGWTCNNGAITSDKAWWKVTLDEPLNCTTQVDLLTDGYKLELNTAGSGFGDVFAGGLNFGDSYLNYYADGKKVYISAKPVDVLNQFSHWNCDGEIATKKGMKVTMDQDRTCTAFFDHDFAVESRNIIVENQIYVLDGFAEQYPLAANQDCLQESISFAVLPLLQVQTFLANAGTWPSDFNNLEWHPTAPNDCTQSIQLKEDADGGFLEMQVHLKDASGTSHLETLIARPPELVAGTEPGSGFRSISYWPWWW